MIDETFNEMIDNVIDEFNNINVTNPIPLKYLHKFVSGKLQEEFELTDEMKCFVTEKVLQFIDYIEEN